MAFGLKGAPMTFQMLMTQEVLVGFIGKFAEAYLDDIMIYSLTEEEHLTHVSMVLERLKIHGLTVNLKKCEFATTVTTYLGHIITDAGNFAQPEKIQAIQEASPPRNMKQLQFFLGLCGWLREYVPNAASILAPFTDLLKQKKWKWTDALEVEFKKVKLAFRDLQPLSRPNSKYPFVLQTDSSDYGIAAVLYQEKYSW